MTSDQVSTISGQWCLVTVRQWKRQSFLRYLQNDIQRGQLQEIILEIVELQEAVYQDMVLIRLSDFSEARSHLQKIEYFQSIQRLRPNEAMRMLNK
ncbi:MAG: chromosome segregation ATPase [Pleurocapsa sp.]